MSKFMIDGKWYEAANYAAARVQHLAAQKPAPGPVVKAPGAAVVTITPVLTPDATFFNRSTVRFGIGEVVKLSFTTIPPGATAASFGGLDWSVGSGPATVVNDPGHLGKGTLTCGTKAGAVTLLLSTATGLAVKKATKRIEVVRPTGVVFAIKPGTNTFHRRGRPSAGFQAVTYLRPTDVSFLKLEFREGGASYEGSGIFARREASRDDLDDSYNVIHPVRADWSTVSGPDSILNGSMVDGYDTVSTETGAIGTGSFRWSIPQLTRVVGTMDDFSIVTLDHVVTTTAAGQMTISKGGVSVTYQLNDPDSDY